MTENKLARLKQKIQNLRSQSNSKQQLKSEQKSKVPLTVCVELVAGVVVGLLLGILLGNLYGNKLLWIIICLTLSMIAAFKTLWQKLYKNHE